MQCMWFKRFDRLKEKRKRGVRAERKKVISGSIQKCRLREGSLPVLAAEALRRHLFAA